MTTIDRLNQIAARPEQILAAAVIRLALSDARQGSQEARTWLEGQSVSWLALVAPQGASVDVLHRRLLAAGGATA